jgi:hypothetical protein
LAFSVNVQLRLLLPPLEHAPDQMASRPLLTFSVIAAPIANDAEPVLPTVTVMPAGLDVFVRRFGLSQRIRRSNRPHAFDRMRRR